MDTCKICLKLRNNRSYSKKRKIKSFVYEKKKPTWSRRWLPKTRKLSFGWGRFRVYNFYFTRIIPENSEITHYETLKIGKNHDSTIPKIESKKLRKTHYRLVEHLKMVERDILKVTWKPKNQHFEKSLKSENSTSRNLQNE